LSQTRSPIEAKVQAAGLAGTAAGVIIWLLQTYAFKGSAVPAGLVSLIYAGVPGVLAFGAGYFAPHTPRTVPPPAPLSAASERLAPMPPAAPQAPPEATPEPGA
jgi:hypothetical protein